MVKVCCCCSKVDVEELKKIVSSEQLEVGCIDQCEGFEGKSFGIVNGEIITADDGAAFLEIVKKSL